MINDLIVSIGRQLNIPQSDDNKWVCRVVYSVAGQMALASLWDHTEDGGSVSIQHFKSRIGQIFDAYEGICPKIGFLLPHDKTDLIEEMYSIYLRNGFFYHSAYQISPTALATGGNGDLVLHRGISPDLKLFMSGLGFYSVQTSTSDRTISSMFGLQKQSFESYLEDNPDTCPFCGNKALTNMLPMLRPWGFAPRNATSIETAQLNEEYSATQQPLYSTLPDADDVTAVNGCANIRMAVRPNQRIIMLNNGVSGKGFTICCDCGAAMPGDDPAVLKDVLRPYRSKFIKTRCKHSDTINVNLGYDFVTDMLVLEFALDRQQIDTNPTRNSWLNRAGQSLAEGLRLAACQELDIEFTELVTGFRVRQNRNGDFVDIYLYDSLSSGAGYAVSIESSIRQLLTKTRELLEGCTCDSACHSCLKHYRNQYIHSVLDRKAALDLLNWGETGARVSAVPYEKQQYLLKSLEQILQISGIHIDVNHESVWAEGRYSKKKVVVYPAMWTKPIEENTIFVSDAHLKYAKPYALKTILDSL